MSVKFSVKFFLCNIAVATAVSITLANFFALTRPIWAIIIRLAPAPIIAHISRKAFIVFPHTLRIAKAIFLLSLCPPSRARLFFSAIITFENCSTCPSWMIFALMVFGLPCTATLYVTKKSLASVFYFTALSFKRLIALRTRNFNFSAGPSQRILSTHIFRLPSPSTFQVAKVMFSRSGFTKVSFQNCSTMRTGYLSFLAIAPCCSAFFITKIMLENLCHTGRHCGIFITPFTYFSNWYSKTLRWRWQILSRNCHSTKGIDTQIINFSLPSVKQQFLDNLNYTAWARECQAHG